MKSTYSVMYIVSLSFVKGVYELQLLFPAPQDEGIETAIEVIEAYDDMPEIETIRQATADHCDDEASVVRFKRLYSLGVKEYGMRVHANYENDDEMFFRAVNESYQDGFCRNCGHNQMVDQDGSNVDCESCRQNAVSSLAVILNII